ncbi:hypothetical protein [Nonomuraea sp. NPDC050691]|uniref:hypothetical protein n=1 Tax=Nonomuraea sp. NPDC050691 TaxID=3155661 RepID=UPI0033DEE730
MGNLLYSAIAFLLSLLPALVLITGVILTARARREHGRAATIGMWGCVVLLLGLALRVAWSLLVPMLVADGGMDTFQVLMLLHGAVDALVTMTGLALLVWAVVVRRARPGAETPAPHTPAPVFTPGRQTPTWEAPAPPPAWETPASHQPRPPYGQEPR